MVVTKVMNTRHLIEVSVVHQSFLLMIVNIATYLNCILSFSSPLTERKHFFKLAGF